MNHIAMPLMLHKIFGISARSALFMRRRYLKSRIRELDVQIVSDIACAADFTERCSLSNVGYFAEGVCDRWGITRKIEQKRRYQWELEYSTAGNNLSRLTEEDLQSARSADIVRLDILPELSKVGVNRNIKCFLSGHDDTNPSMRIYSGGKGFYCFGCGVSGNAIDAVMQIRGMSFLDAVRFIRSRQ